MLTVPEAARRTGRNAETIRRWIRTGRLRATRVGTQHVIDELDLDAVASSNDVTPLPGWLAAPLPDGRRQPDWERLVRDARSAH